MIEPTARKGLCTPLSLIWGSTCHGCVVVIPTPEEYGKPDPDTGEDGQIQICVWSTRDDSESVWIYDSPTGLRRKCQCDMR